MRLDMQYLCSFDLHMSIHAATAEKLEPEHSRYICMVIRIQTHTHARSHVEIHIEFHLSSIYKYMDAINFP